MTGVQTCALPISHGRFLGTLLLLDIIVKDPTTTDVLLAVYVPFNQLNKTVILCMFSIYIFAFKYFQNFGAEFAYSDDEAFYQDCVSLMNCFKVTFDYGLRLSGGVGDIMTKDLDERVGRVLFSPAPAEWLAS